MAAVDLIRATPNTVEAIRKAHAIRKDLMPDDSFQYSFPSPKHSYTGQWAVQLDGAHCKVPAPAFGNLILTEDRVFHAVTDDLQSSQSVLDTGVSWCYLHVDLERGISIELKYGPIEHTMSYADYSDDYIPLAVYSPETGLVQLQYGPVRLNRYWVYDDGSGSGGGSEEEA